MSELSDEALVKRVINSDQELYVHIVERYQAPLIRYVRTLLFDEEQAADVVQGVFIKAFINLRGFNTKRKFSSWLYRIAHNEAVDYIRKHKRELSPDDEDWFDSLPDDSEPIENIIDNKLAKEALAIAVANLPLKYREVLVLNVYQRKSYRQISDILRMPQATVGVRINRAKIMLREQLNKEGVKRDEN